MQSNVSKKYEGLVDDIIMQNLKGFCLKPAKLEKVKSIPKSKNAYKPRSILGILLNINF